MDQITHTVRREYWLAIIKECQGRPENISAKQWLSENSIWEKSYYYWLRKFRKEAYEQMQQLPASAAEKEITFAELPIPVEKDQVNIMPIISEHTNCSAAVIKANGFTIELSNRISSDLLAVILKEMSHA